MVSSGLLRRVALVRTDVSEEPGASFIRVTSNRRTLRRTVPGGSNEMYLCITESSQSDSVPTHCPIKSDPMIGSSLRDKVFETDWSFHQVTCSRMVELYCISAIRLYGLVLN
jgi:hypothetical protein